MEAVGKIQRTFGAHGELAVALYRGCSLPTSEPVYVEVNGLAVPFYVRTAKEYGQRSVVVFDDMETEALAAELVGKEIMVPQHPRPRHPKSAPPGGEGATLDELVGYRVVDLSAGELGTINDWLDYPGNPCLQVLNAQGQEILIPANEDLIISIDRGARLLSVDLPQGLTDVYLGGTPQGE